MIFGYEELKEYVEEDYNRFSEFGFSDSQMLNAVLAEYEHGNDYTVSEEFCILVILAMLYKIHSRDATQIYKRLEDLVNLKKDAISTELSDEIKMIIQKVIKPFGCVPRSLFLSREGYRTKSVVG